MARFSAGDWVWSKTRGQAGVVTDTQGNMTQVVFLEASGPEWVATSTLEPWDQTARSFLEAEEFLSRLTAYKLSRQLTNVVYGYLASRTYFRPYQFLPVLRFLESPVRRFLIADEVGLGKTIEAGLIWLELLARNQAERVLVVCPSHLREKWRRELLRRFDIDARIVDRGKEIDDLIADLQSTPELAGRPRRLIVSLDTLARGCRTAAEASSRAEALAETGLIWDLLIVDEAHHARNTGTKRNQALSALGSSVEAELFLTATPLNLGRPDLFNLLRLLQPDRFQSPEAFEQEMRPAVHVTAAIRSLRRGDAEDAKAQLLKLGRGLVGTRVRNTVAYREAMRLLDSGAELTPRKVALIERSIRELRPLSGVFSRTRKRDLTEPFAEREVMRVPVDWSRREREVYDALIAWARTQTSHNPFAVVMPARQTASCLPAMVQRIEAGDWDYEPAEGLEQDTNRKFSLPDTSPTWRRVQRALAQLPPGLDSKFDRFTALLRELFAGRVDQVLLFSFFRRTISYLAERLKAEGYSVDVIHGGIPLQERYRIMDRFRRGSTQILLSSEVGAEGLDFEFCGCLVNYDLPWNPMRVEQRIGRLDRFGQKHEKILIVNFHIPGTIETDIFERLYDRIGVFEQSIGELDDILGEEIEDKAFEIACNLRLTPAERERRLEQLAINLEHRRQLVEDLESHRELLAASDELLNEDFDSIRGGGRYLEPAEVERLVRRFFDEHYPGTQWRPQGPGVYSVTFDSRLGLGEGPLGMEVNHPDLRWIRDGAYNGSPVDVTFDGQRAIEDHRLRFVNSRHPLVAAIAREVHSDQRELWTAIRLYSRSLEPGRYLLALFEATLSGADRRTTLLPIAIDMSTLQRVESIEAGALGALIGNADLEQLGNPQEDWSRLEDAIMQVADAERQQLEDQAKVENELLYERRRQATAATFEPKIRAIRKTVERTRGMRVEAANRQRLANLESRYEQQLARLEQLRDADVSLLPVAKIVLEVAPRIETAASS